MFVYYLLDKGFELGPIESKMHFLKIFSFLLKNLLMRVSKKINKQAGAELCQAQGKLKFAWL